MGRVPVDLRRNVSTNIRNYRRNRYPMWGGAKLCAIDFGVTPQQWSQWERGAHMPDEYRMMELADFFGVTTADLRRETRETTGVRYKPSAKSVGTRRFERAAASKIVNGVEVPLRVEVERLVRQSEYTIRMERVV
jgi:transcriptional regulator with XRE-family HTH domain